MSNAPSSAPVRDAQYWVRHLDLIPHPEGGFYKGMNRGNFIVRSQNNKRRFAYTTIYFMLTPESASHFHRLPADEVWCWHAGDSIDVHVIYQNADDDDLITRDDAGGPRTDSESVPEGTSFVPAFLEERRKQQTQPSKPYDTYRAVRVGANLEAGEVLQYTVPAGAIFGSSLVPGGSAGYTLLSCVVSPGFDFRDFELFTQDQLMALCPQHEDIIRRLAYEKLPEE